MKKKRTGKKKNSFRGQWQNKTKRRFIYLFIFKNEAAILRVELLTQHFHNKI